MLYAQVIGSYDWRCPNCNHQNRHRINLLKFKFKCRNPRCEYTHVFGVAHWQTVTGRKSPPPDQMVFEAGVWRSGSRTNVVLCEGCGRAIVGVATGSQHQPEPISVAIPDIENRWTDSVANRQCHSWQKL